MLKPDHRWETGVTGTLIEWPRGRTLERSALLDVLSEALGVTEWQEVHGPYATGKPAVVSKCRKLLRNFHIGAITYGELLGQLFDVLSREHRCGHSQQRVAGIEFLPKDVLRDIVNGFNAQTLSCSVPTGINLDEQWRREEQTARASAAAQIADFIAVPRASRP